MKSLYLLSCVALVSACSTQPASDTAAGAQAPTAKISITTKSPDALAHYQKGETLVENIRPTEGIDELNQALKIDPDFAMAKLLRGVATPGPDGLKDMDEAAAAARSLPEAERTLIEGAVADRRGDLEKARTSFRRVVELAPADFLGHYFLGQRLLADQKYADAAQSLKKATELSPTAGGAQNMLGYAALNQGDAAGAIAAFEEYARILPQEPNAQDSLGEALLGAGRFAEAEAAFQKALALSPEFWAAHEGIAYTKFYAGDWAGGQAALLKAKATAARLADKLSVDELLAAAAVAQRDPARALRALDVMEKSPGAKPSDIALVPLLRGQVLIDSGRDRDAMAPLATALATADSGTLPPARSRGLSRGALRLRVTAEAHMGDAGAAQKTSAALDAEATARPDDPIAQTAMHFGRGMLALAGGDAKAALAELDQCSREDRFCSWQRVIAAEKTGDKAAMAARREEALKVYVRTPGGLVMRSRLSASGAS